MKFVHCIACSIFLGQQSLVPCLVSDWMSEWERERNRRRLKSWSCRCEASGEKWRHVKSLKGGFSPFNSLISSKQKPPPQLLNVNNWVIKAYSSVGQTKPLKTRHWPYFLACLYKVKQSLSPSWDAFFPLRKRLMINCCESPKKTPRAKNQRIFILRVWNKNCSWRNYDRHF